MHQALNILDSNEEQVLSSEAQRVVKSDSPEMNLQ